MGPATLLILAAGLGTRYGGLKQLNSVGPSGELIMDYSIHNALQAGIDRVVFVVRRAMEEAFRERIARRIEEQVETAYVYQEPASCLPASIPTIHRWGTGHALLVAREAIETPFVVINADDDYGRRSFRSWPTISGRRPMLTDVTLPWWATGWTTRCRHTAPSVVVSAVAQTRGI